MAELTPEQKARVHLDEMLVASGWAVQDYKAFDPSAARGIALREVPLKSGRCDYLLLVDRANLGCQAKGEFDQFVTPDTGRKFTELYNVQHLQSNKLDDVARVTVRTIQRLYSMLRGEEMDEDLDEKSGFELAAADDREREVKYNPAIPTSGIEELLTA
jgi:type I site-specific restriction endonuclease